MEDIAAVLLQDPSHTDNSKALNLCSVLCIRAVCLVTRSCPILCNPMDCSSPGSSVHEDSPSKNTGVPCPPPGDLPNPGVKCRSPTLQVDSLPSEPPGKPKNTAVGSLSFPQGIFLTQGLILSLLHCRQILDHLSHQGSPRILEWVADPFSRGSSQPRTGGFFTR